MSTKIFALVILGLVAPALSARPWLGEWLSNEANKPPVNLKKFLEILGLPNTATGGNATVGLSIVERGDRITVIIESPAFLVQKTLGSFKIGELTHGRPGTNVTYTFTEDGDKLKGISDPPGNTIIPAVTSYEVNGDELTWTMTMDDVEVKRYFKKYIYVAAASPE